MKLQVTKNGQKAIAKEIALIAMTACYFMAEAEGSVLELFRHSGM